LQKSIARSAKNSAYNRIGKGDFNGISYTSNYFRGFKFYEFLMGHAPAPTVLFIIYNNGAPWSMDIRFPREDVPTDKPSSAFNGYTCYSSVIAFIEAECIRTEKDFKNIIDDGHKRLHAIISKKTRSEKDGTCTEKDGIGANQLYTAFKEAEDKIANDDDDDIDPKNSRFAMLREFKIFMEKNVHFTESKRLHQSFFKSVPDGGNKRRSEEDVAENAIDDNIDPGKKKYKRSAPGVRRPKKISTEPSTSIVSNDLSEQDNLSDILTKVGSRWFC
jgi:hypothetical protein